MNFEGLKLVPFRTVRLSVERIHIKVPVSSKPSGGILIGDERVTNVLNVHRVFVDDDGIIRFQGLMQNIDRSGIVTERIKNYITEQGPSYQIQNSGIFDLFINPAINVSQLIFYEQDVSFGYNNTTYENNTDDSDFLFNERLQ